MTELRDRLWIWGQTPNTHHGPSGHNYNLPHANRMTALEGAYYFGIPNCCRVVSEGLPVPPFDQEAMVLDSLRRVVWSIIGCGGSTRNDGGGDDTDEVIRIARQHPNVVGAIMDDFMREPRLSMNPPEKLMEFKRRMNQQVGRQMDLWTVIYTHELDSPVKAHLAACDVVSLWTWWAKDLTCLDRNLAKLKGLLDPGKPVLCGCYMWDYGGGRPMPMDLIAYQLDQYHELLMKKQIQGIIFCSNCIADLELKAVDYARDWIKKHSADQIPD